MKKQSASEAGPVTVPGAVATWHASGFCNLCTLPLFSTSEEGPMSFTRDLRQAFRIIRSKLGFSIMAVLMLALGIGACTSIFTVVNAVLLRPLPYPESNRLVQLFGGN